MISGNFLANLSIALLSVGFIFLSFTENLKSYFYNKFFIIFIIWWILLVISSLVSSDPFFSLSASLLYFRFGIFCIVIWYLLENDQNAIRYFTYTLILSFALIIVDSYIQFFLGRNLIGYSYLNGRLGSFFGDELIVGNFLSRLYPLMLGLIFFMKINQKFYFFCALVIFILVDVIIFLSGERVAFFNLILSSLAIILLIQKWKAARILTLITSLAIIFLVSVSNETVKNRMVDQTVNKLGIKDGSLYIFSEEHQNFYISSFKMFLDKPILGHGPKMYRLTCRDDKYFFVSQNTGVNTCNSSPHGTYPQLLAETGLLGTLPVLFAFLTILRLFTKSFILNLTNSKPLLSDFQICMLSAILITVWPVVPSGNFFNSWFSIIFYLPVGFLLYSNNINK